MSILKWGFTMGTTSEPTWSVHQLSTANDWRLVAYAKRARDGGWFVRIGNVNPQKSDEKMYIGEDVFPPDYMLSMLHMTHRKPGEDDE
jgi:hypothetical protein